MKIDQNGVATASDVQSTTTANEYFQNYVNNEIKVDLTQATNYHSGTGGLKLNKF